MNRKLEMMFADNKKATQCRLRALQELSSVEIISMSLQRQRQISSVATHDYTRAGKDWLSDISEDTIEVQSLFEFSNAVVPRSTDWDFYRESLAQYYLDYEMYLKKKNEHELLVGRTATLELKMLNAGESIERDLWVQMFLPENISLYSEDDYPQAPSEPMEPIRPQSIYEKMLAGQLDLQKREPMAVAQKIEKSIISDLKIFKNNGYDVSFRVKKLPQQGRVVVGKFYVVFPNVESARSFQIDYTVLNDRRHPVKTGQLSIQVANDRK